MLSVQPIKLHSSISVQTPFQLVSVRTGANAGLRTVANQNTNFTVETAWLADSNRWLALCVAIAFRSRRTVALVQLFIGVCYVVTERTWVTEVDNSASWILGAVDSRAGIAGLTSANKRTFKILANCIFIAVVLPARALVDVFACIVDFDISVWTVA